ncbi:hypothetical protein JKY79_01765, partial [Candidatus Babeliales bacterium]|nr:hypothetical protein [Candidatus Babeliales bacterium]
MKKLFIILGLISSFQFCQGAEGSFSFMGVHSMTEEERAGNKAMELRKVYCSFKEDPCLATVDEENFKELIKIIYQQSVDKLNIFLDDDKKKVVIDLEIKYQALHFVKKWIDKAPSTQWVEFEDVLSYAIAQGNKEIITRLLLEGLLYDERSISTT